MPSHVIEFFEKVISLFVDGATYEDLRKRYFGIYHKSLGKSTLTSYLAPLEDLGWISIITHPDDKRQRIVVPEKKPDITSEFCLERLSKLFGLTDLKEWLGGDAEIVRKGPEGKSIVEGEDFLMNYFIKEQETDSRSVEDREAENASKSDSEQILVSNN